MKRIFSKLKILLIALFLGLAFNFLPVSVSAASTKFFVDSYYDFTNREEITAQSYYESDRAYYYIEDDYLDTLSLEQKNQLKEIIKKLGKSFDQEIYPKLTQLLGDIWNPGIDNDPRITIFFTKLTDGVGGYFNAADEMTLSQNSASNVREMIYLSADFLFDQELKSYVAHEFQHLITYNQKERIQTKTEDIWLNELRGEYVSTFLGYDTEDYNNSNLKARIEKFLQYPSDPLTEWRGRLYDYLPINLLAQYFADHYGNGFFSQLTRNSDVGIDSINNALRTAGGSNDFTKIFGDWMISLYLNDARQEVEYGFLNYFLRNLHVSPTAQYEVFPGLAILRSGLIKEWMPLWYEIAAKKDTNNEVVISFNGSAARGEFRAKILKMDSAGNYFVSDWNFSDGKTGEITMHRLGGDLKKIVIMPYLIYNSHYQDETLDYNNFSLSVTSNQETESVPTSTLSVINSSNQAQSSFIQDGDLVRAKDDYKVYIINGNYRRHILSDKIFSFYGHLNWALVKEISLSELNRYQESNFVRADGDKRVYEIDGSGQKHWLNITGEEFVSSGRDWKSVYVINNRERDFYKISTDIKS
ncbi:MAG: hypothetical protein WC242_01420 [Candidatus Paceibacterota bacterium]|jgi:hypothetical protein